MKWSRLILCWVLLILALPQGGRAQSPCLPLYSLPCLPPPVCTFPCPTFGPGLPAAPALPQSPYPSGFQAPPPPYASGIQPPARAADPGTPQVTLALQVAATVAPMQDIEYQIVIRNQAQAAAHHVLVRNPLPLNARFVRATPEPNTREGELVWQFGTLEAGAAREIKLLLAPINQEEVKNCARVQFEHGQCVTTHIARPSISLRKLGPAQAMVNERLRYQLIVTNTGPIAVADIIVTDLLPPGLENPNGKASLIVKLDPLEPGQSKTIEYEAIARQIGQHTNRAVASSVATGLKESQESTVTVSEPKLSVTMNGPAVGYLNYPAVYQITVTNSGGLTLGNIVLNDSIPAQTSFVSASEGGRLMGNYVQWLLGALAPGQSRTLDVVLRPNAVVKVTNRAEATSDRGITGQAEFTTAFAGAAALGVEIVNKSGPVPVGGTTTYSIAVRNQGMVPATNVRIAADIPTQMQVVRAQPADYRMDGAVLRFEPLTIPPGGESRYQVEVKALRAGDVRFSIILTADQLPAGPVRQQESTTIYSAAPMVRIKEIRD